MAVIWPLQGKPSEILARSRHREAIAECGMRNADRKIRNPRSKIQNRRVGKPSLDVIAVRMFRVKASQADMVILGCPVFLVDLAREAGLLIWDCGMRNTDLLESHAVNI